MGRKSEYGKEQQKKETTANEVKKKIGVEPISIKEIAIYLNQYNQRNCTYDEKTVKNYIKAICKDSNCLLSESDFKKASGSPHSKYEIKPEYQGLLLTLLDTSYFDGRKNDRILSTREQLNGELLINIETFLNEEDLKAVKGNPIYINTRVESALTERLNNICTSLFRELFHSDQVIRHTMLKFVIEELTKVYQHVAKWNCETMATKVVSAHACDFLPDAIYQTSLFSADTLKEYIINLLALRVHKKTDLCVDTDEELSPVALYLASQIYDIEIKADLEAEKMLNEIDQNISQLEKYNEIKGKAEKILDLNNPIEKVMHHALIKLCRCYYVAPEVSSEDYKRTIKFIESAIADDKWDILSKFMNGHVSSGIEGQLAKLEHVKKRISDDE